MKIGNSLGIVLLLLLTSCKRGEQDVILAPASFKGHIIILFNQKNGIPAKYIDGKRIYEIPTNGILKTKFPRNFGWREFTLFYRGNISEGNQLPAFAQLSKVPENVVVGLMGPTGSHKKDMLSNDRYEFAEFYIGTKSEIDSLVKFTKIIDVSEIAH